MKRHYFYKLSVEEEYHYFKYTYTHKHLKKNLSSRNLHSSRGDKKVYIAIIYKAKPTQ